LVQLPGNNSQVLAWSDENGNVTILNQMYVFPTPFSLPIKCSCDFTFAVILKNADLSSFGNSSTNTTVINSTQWGSIFINQINGVLIPPGNVTTALNTTNATVTFNLLETIQIPSANGTNETATQFLQDAVGITFFVPNDAAFKFTSVVNQTISSLQSNVSALAAVLENHVSLLSPP
jgi:hypothetical protein